MGKRRAEGAEIGFVIREVELAKQMIELLPQKIALVASRAAALGKQ